MNEFFDLLLQMVALLTRQANELNKTAWYIFMALGGVGITQGILILRLNALIKAINKPKGPDFMNCTIHPIMLGDFR